MLALQPRTSTTRFVKLLLEAVRRKLEAADQIGKDPLVTQQKIKIASPDDAPSLLEAMQAFYLEEGLSFDRTKAEAALGELLANGSLGCAVLVTDSHRVVGYAVATVGFSLEFGGRFLLLDELYVDVSARGRGLASGLLDAVASYAREIGVQSIRLEVDHSNAAAQAIYERRGFARHDRHLMTLYLPAKEAE